MPSRSEEHYTYLSITRSGKCFWSSENKYECTITAVELIDIIYYVIDNIYVSVGNKVFRQCIGIPMGTDCAPLLANLYLFHFEYIYIRKLICNNMCKARSFCTTFRYINNLLTLNNLSFESVINEIYPSELVLKKTTENCGIVSYWDVGFMVRDGHFIIIIIIQLYSTGHKRKDIIKTVSDTTKLC